MKKAIIIIFVGLITGLLTAQSPLVDWSYPIGDSLDFSEGKEITVDSEGNSYSVGKFYRTIDFDSGNEIYELSEHNPNGDMYILKIDPEGNFLWAKNIGPSAYPSSIILDSMNNILISGHFYGITDFDPDAGIQNVTSQGSSDYFLLKLNQFGEFVWVQQFGDVGVDRYSKIISGGPDNSYYYSFGLNLLKLKDNGDIVWTKNFESSSEGSINSLKVSKSGNLYMVGTFAGTMDMDPDLSVNEIIAVTPFKSNLFVLKLDVLGSFIWGGNIGGKGDIYCNSLTIDSMENVYMTGSFTDTVDVNPDTNEFVLKTGYNSDMFLMKLDKNGHLQWANGTGGQFMDRGLRVELDSEGNIYTTGTFIGKVDFDPNETEHFLNTLHYYHEQIYIRKMDPNGNLIWAYQSMGNRHSIPFGLSIDKSNNILVTGWFNGNIDFDLHKPSDQIYYADASNAFVFKISQDSITAIKHLDKVNHFKIYPNPTDGMVQLDLAKKYPNVTIRISDLQGRVVFTKEVVNQQLITFEFNESPGIYLVRVFTDNDREFAVSRLIKN